MLAETSRRRWRSSQFITVAALALWFLVSFAAPFFARSLSGKVFGWPVSFWVASQGVPLTYLLIVCVYAGWMRRLDEEHGAGASL
jgi:putative solute:sodium symporter small subunit